MRWSARTWPRNHGVSLEAFIKNAFDSRGQENRYTECTVNVCAANVPGIPQAVYAVPITPMTMGIKVAQRFRSNGPDRIGSRPVAYRR